jgi:hypothetical protein
MSEFLAVERRTLQSSLPGLLASDAGRYVLIHGSEIVGIFPSEDDALGAGYERFGVQGVFLVQRIAETNRVAVLTPFFLE